jgi:3-dehydroquinate synthase
MMRSDTAPADVDTGGGAPAGEGIRIPVAGYDVIVASGALARLGVIVADAAPAHRYALISDDTVAPLHAERVLAALAGKRVDVFTVPPGEGEKTRERWAWLTDRLLAADCGRDTVILALGGGVVGDLAGFVAATYMRGIPVVQLPTTLLAMIDASIGGKTGVDTAAGKNLVGAFHQPAVVVADPEVLRTLPARHFRAGLAEAIKHGVVADAGYLAWIERDVLPVPVAGPELPFVESALGELIARSVAIKADVVRRDEREHGVRKILNFGHTVGHAIELLSGYELLHGEAIAIGMVVEALLADRLGIDAWRVDGGGSIHGALARILGVAGLPTSVPRYVRSDELIAAMRLDKKARGGEIEMALPRRLGEMSGADSGWAVRVPESEIRRALA